jgi:ATP-binding cassette subfamily F protein 3
MDYIENIPSERTGAELRGLLGAFLFSGDAVYKKIKVLSGGEKARLSLCGLLLSPSNVIILDEPTNHLDIFAKDILKQALIQYSGTLILVSHDRHFLSGLTDRVIEFSDKKIREYPGDIDSYLDEQEVTLEVPVKKEKKKEKVILYKQKKEIDKQLRFLNKENKNIEIKIENIEKEIKKFNELLNEVNKGNINNQIDYNDYSRLNNLLNVQLENWEKNQNEINKITKNVRSNE